MHKKYIFLFLIISRLAAFSHTPSYFTENKGQLHTQDHLPNPSVKYIFNAEGMNVQLKAAGFSYDTYTISRESANASKLPSRSAIPASFSYHFHRIDVEFLNANPSPQIVAEQLAGGLSHYNTIHSIRSFQKITYKDLYPNTDLEFISNGRSVKYNFILHPGADISAIRWIYKGAASQGLDHKAIVITHSNGHIKEVIPESFILSDNKKKNVNISFSQKDGVYSFKSKTNPGANETLVIDPSPVLDWSTYYGSTGNESGNATATDPSGNVIIVGVTDSPANIATNGIHQSTFGGSTDAFVAKFDNSGNRQWCSYLGGAGDDVARSVATTTTGIIYFAGQTTSTTSISFGTVHQTSFGGLYDAFITKLDGTGLMIWSTYYGGTGYEDGNSISLDASDNVYITGYTDSPNAMVSGGAHQTSFGGVYDAYVAKFDVNGTRQWGTYYGGGADDYGLATAVDNSGNVFFVGQTSSVGGISTPAAHQIALGGNDDAFLVKLNTNGVRQWGTYFGDVPNETAFGACVDPSGNVYMCGQTSSSISIATAGVMQQYLSGGPDAFVAKFNTSGGQMWGTYYGDTGTDVANSLLADGSGLVVTGETNSSSNMATTNSQQGSFGGVNDAFLLKLTLNGVRQWSTYFGGNGDDAGNDVSRDPSGKYFMTGVTSSSTSISTPGAYQPVKDASYDAFLARFENGCFNPVAPTNSTPASNLDVCSGNSAMLLASGVGNIGWYTASTGGNYIGGGSPFATPSLTTSSTPTTITFYAQDSTVCGASLGRTAITVSVEPAASVSFTLPAADTAVCVSHSHIILTGNSPSGGTFSGTGVSGAAFTPSVAGIGTFTITYMVAIGNCSNTAQWVINVRSCAGIEEYELMNETVTIYPNPNNGSFSMSSVKEGNFTIVNSIGQTVRTIRMTEAASSEHISGLAPGIYFICGSGENAAVRKKIVVE